jgi:hypothetical protein
MPGTWEPLLSTARGMFAAAGSWVALEFVGRPYRKFLDLRGEIIRRVTEIANVKPAYRPNPDKPVDFFNEVLSHDEIKRLREAESMLRDLASQMSAFATNETAARWLAVKRGYDPGRASGALFGLSNEMHRKGAAFATHRHALEDALQLARHTL